MKQHLELDIDETKKLFSLAGKKYCQFKPHQIILPSTNCFVAHATVMLGQYAKAEFNLCPTIEAYIGKLAEEKARVSVYLRPDHRLSVNGKEIFQVRTEEAERVAKKRGAENELLGISIDIDAPEEALERIEYKLAKYKIRYTSIPVAAL